MVQGSGFDELKDLRVIELEDDYGHLIKDNQELRLKIKDVSQQNSMLRLRLIELNDILKDITSKDNDSEEEAMGQKLMQLIEENDSLRQ